MNNTLEYHPVRELEVCGHVSGDVLTRIRGSLTDPCGPTTYFAQFNLSSGLVSSYCGANPSSALVEVAGAIAQAGVLIGRTEGIVQIHASLVDYQLFGWHAEIIDGAFVVSDKAATEGLRGAVLANNRRDAMLAANKIVELDPELESVDKLEIVRPPVGSLLHLPHGALHRSPRKKPGHSDKRLLVNAVIMPKFLAHNFDS